VHPKLYLNKVPTRPVTRRIHVDFLLAAPLPPSYLALACLPANVASIAGLLLFGKAGIVFTLPVGKKYRKLYPLQGFIPIMAMPVYE
jgi:hypothetical protein